MVQNCQGMKSIGTRSLNSWSGRDQVWNIKSSSPFIRTQRLEHDFKRNHKCDSIQFHHFLPWRRESESLSFQAQPTEPRFVSRSPFIHANRTFGSFLIPNQASSGETPFAFGSSFVRSNQPNPVSKAIPSIPIRIRSETLAKPNHRFAFGSSPISVPA